MEELQGSTKTQLKSCLSWQNSCTIQNKIWNIAFDCVYHVQSKEHWRHGNRLGTAYEHPDWEHTDSPEILNQINYSWHLENPHAHTYTHCRNMERALLSINIQNSLFGIRHVCTMILGPWSMHQWKTRTRPAPSQTASNYAEKHPLDNLGFTKQAEHAETY